MTSIILLFSLLLSFGFSNSEEVRCENNSNISSYYDDQCPAICSTAFGIHFATCKPDPSAKKYCCCTTDP
ncbi:hypothetical protein NC652_012406 [Populus alba x Populus x berolinensis]|nr:hypothetical protein NC652_012406 [Populus alba x Populus x berolinensis]